MVHGPVLALPNDCGSSENDSQHRHIVDDPHYAGEPCGGDVGIERNPHVKINRQQRYSLRMREEIRYLGGDHLLRIARSKTRLYHCGRVNVDLESWLASSKNIPLKIRRDIDHEGIFPLVHEGNDIPLSNQLR